MAMLLLYVIQRPQRRSLNDSAVFGSSNPEFFHSLQRLDQTKSTTHLIIFSIPSNITKHRSFWPTHGIKKAKHAHANSKSRNNHQTELSCDGGLKPIALPKEKLHATRDISTTLQPTYSVCSLLRIPCPPTDPTLAPQDWERTASGSPKQDINLSWRLGKEKGRGASIFIVGCMQLAESKPDCLMPGRSSYGVGCRRPTNKDSRGCVQAYPTWPTSSRVRRPRCRRLFMRVPPPRSIHRRCHRWHDLVPCDSYHRGLCTHETTRHMRCLWDCSKTYADCRWMHEIDNFAWTKKNNLCLQIY